MPLYTYRCNGCGKTEEVLQSFKELEQGIDTPVSCCCDGSFERLMDQAHIGLCDTSMLRSALRSRDQFDNPKDDRGEYIGGIAKRAGVDTTGRWYNPSIARFLGDPEAWVGSMDEIKQVCNRRGWRYTVKDGNILIQKPMEVPAAAGGAV